METLVLAHVLIPPINESSVEALSTPKGFVTELQRGAFRVKEVTIRRWVPARMKQ